jgi:glyoxylase-like metal-dependent hydrolase (beta-lactamase superfamily II)
MTHLHLDHFFGLMAKDTNAPTFPNAQIHIPATEYAYWTNPTTKGAPADRIRAVFPGWKNIRQFEGDVEVVPGIRAVNSNGHTPGHTSYHVASGGQQLMVLGDPTNVRALNMTNPGWHLVFDVDPNLAETNRHKLLDRVVADKVVATGYHWGAPGAGTVEKDGKGYALVAVKA